MRINFPGKLQKCAVCGDWIVSPQGQPMPDVCPYCGALQRPSTRDGEKHSIEVKTKGDVVDKRDAALIAFRLKQQRAQASSGGSADPYPAPDGDFKPTLGDITSDHVMLGNIALIAVDLVFAFFGLVSRIAFLEVLVGIVAAGTIVDTWVHKFFH